MFMDDVDFLEGFPKSWTHHDTRNNSSEDMEDLSAIDVFLNSALFRSTKVIKILAPPSYFFQASYSRISCLTGTPRASCRIPVLQGSNHRAGSVCVCLVAVSWCERRAGTGKIGLGHQARKMGRVLDCEMEWVSDSKQATVSVL